jgi:Family of unknown function (DUF6262)
MTADMTARVESACTDLVDKGEPITFTAVANAAGIAKATLYRRPELRAIIEEHRHDDREAHSLSGIVVEIGLLRHGLEALSAKVRQHDEQLKAMRGRSPKPR